MVVFVFAVLVLARVVFVFALVFAILLLEALLPIWLFDDPQACVLSSVISTEFSFSLVIYNLVSLCTNNNKY